MIHLGDITKIDWSTVPPVDCVTGGSPCQDLSVAGKRAGLAGERSGLYMEQIRCVKELRKADERRGRTAQSIRPRYMVWENVPGAFSSNGGEDFRAVLEEAAKIADETAVIPRPSGKWSNSGAVLGDGWSLAWRVHDAQFWGVPQRRRRISLVCDFGGLSAPEILFERKGVPGNFEQSGAQREEATGGAGKGAESASRTDARGNGKTILFEPRSQDGVPRIHGEVTPTLNTAQGGQRHPCVMCIGNGQADQSIGCDIYNQEVTGEVAASLTAASGGTNTSGPKVLSCGFKPRQMAAERVFHGDEAWNSLAGNRGSGHSRGTDYTALCIGNGQANQSVDTVVGALNTMHDQQAVMVPDVAHTLKAKASCDFRADSETYPVQNSVVRRLTPLECTRLQGYPDGWVDIGDWVDSKGKKHKDADSPKYKALGNSIALPFWFWLLRRISAQYYRPATLGSLFDGISGFCYVWARCNGSKSCLWASEIEEFPIAVCKRHFGDEESGEVGDILEYL